mgnify:CR=1 FL=1
MRSKEIYRRIYMSTKEAKQMDKALFDFYGKPSIGQALPLAIQHVLAMIVGCVTPSIIVAGVAGISQEDSVILIQAALVMSALTTLLQLFPFIKTKNFRIGSALPVMMGISFAYVPSMQAIASDFDIATILGAQIIGGVVALLVGLNIKRIRKFFPPLITGTVVFSIGLSLYPTAINYMAGGASSKTYGSWQNWVVAIITLIIVTALNHYGKGVWKLASILIGIIAGYIVALFFGMVDFHLCHRQRSSSFRNQCILESSLNHLHVLQSEFCLRSMQYRQLVIFRQQQQDLWTVCRQMKN